MGVETDIQDNASAAITAVVPIVPVRRVARAVDFYTGVLGFELKERDGPMTFAYIERDGIGLMLLDLDDHRAVKATHDYFSAYLWVDDLARLHSDLAPKLEALPRNRYQPLYAKPDGRHEFHVTDPDGFLLFFGQTAR